MFVAIVVDARRLPPVPNGLPMCLSSGPNGFSLRRLVVIGTVGLLDPSKSTTYFLLNTIRRQSKVHR
jgi:hypothetical protein